MIRDVAEKEERDGMQSQGSDNGRHSGCRKPEPQADENLHHRRGANQQIDMQIGAIARTLPNCVVVTKDNDLAAIPGITVENWAS